ncbi:MAG: histidine phosphatase family protein [Rhodospirillales bacterium]|nr:histidine phosphatase family protein [Rhodospirillales bacterium]MDH3791350.1 histidine phosphatase family protein [Rhodospirillales bacterium]MDH3910578.1 histidine phosphatase family protein [Rhodospirillales bacterium]MDH3917033.1 histidine phosphatase family protein [Rhodospirillales bacterium]MDH3966419.1 histidine phosphatase family protein [Rhodospirillales bacterium]
MIYLLRHGETIWNVERRLQGRKDSPLTLRGISQARAVAGLLRDLINDPSTFTVVASPLARTWQTAVIVSQSLGLDCRAIRFEPRLQEHHFGLWEGLTWQEIEARFPDLWEQRRADKWAFEAPGGESYARVAARVRSWLDEQSADSRLIVVGHGLAGRVLRGLYGSLPQAEVMEMLEPQGSLYRLAEGTIAAFQAEPD